MPHTQLFNPIALFFIVAALLVPAFPTWSQNPDYTNIEDIRGGRRDVYPVDDIVVVQLDSSAEVVTRSLFETTDGSASDSTPLPNSETATILLNGTLATRMYNLPRDVLVTAYYNGFIQNHFIDVVDHGGAMATSFFASNQDTVWLKAADFNGDGFTELLHGTASPGMKINIIGPIDIDDISQQLQQSQDLNVPDNSQAAVGDFNGDGRDEIVLISPNCNTSSDFNLEIYTVDPDSFVITRAAGICLDSPTGVPNNEYFVAAGQFAPAAAGASPPLVSLPDQIAVTFGSDNVDVTTGSAFAMFVVDPDTWIPQKQGQPIAEPPSAPGSGWQVAGGGRILEPKAARMVWNTFQVTGQAQPQSSEWLVAVSLERNLINGVFVNVIFINLYTFDAELNVILSQFVSFDDSSACGDGRSKIVTGLSDYAIGNFDQPNTNPDLQIVISFFCMVVEGGPTESGINIVTFPDIAQANAVNATVGQFIQSGDNVHSLPLATGDFQGRSLLLGAPQIFRFSNISPDLVIGSPPMHVDFSRPVGSSSPTALNLSAMVAGSGYAAGLGRTISGSGQTSKTSTTSWSAGGSGSLGEQAEIGGVFWAFSEAITAQVQGDYQSNVGNVYNTSEDVTFNASAETGFGDVLQFQKRRLNIYTYPVIGQTSCPFNNSGCTVEEQIPLYLLYSGIDEVVPMEVNAAQVEWYQPPHQPGNILTYPATLDLLNAGRLLTNPAFNLSASVLTPTGLQTIFTDDSKETISVNWSASSGQESSVGSSWTVGGNLSGSFTTLGGRSKGENQGSITTSVNLKANYASSQLQTSKQSIAGSTGLTIAKPGIFPNPAEYAYGFQGMIFGQPDPLGTLDPGNLDDLSVPAQITTTGPLEVAFIVDPTNQGDGTGSWWSSAQSYYEAPDVGFVQPSQWTLTDISSTGDNCVGNSATGPTKSCATFNAPPDLNSCPSCLWTSEFYRMKGLMVTIEAVDGTTISQTNIATEGDQVTLKLRVYNKSFAFMQPDSEVKVRFYRQPWNPRDNVPRGDSVLIAELSSSPIAPFNMQTLNWDLISTTFDTTDLGGRAFIFWAVTWIEHDNELVTEMPEHGLTSIPASNITDISQIPVQAYSNNVGFYPVVFQVLNAAPPTSSAADSGVLTLSFIDAQADQSPPHSPPLVLVGDTIDVSAQLQATGAPAEQLLVTIANGHPEFGGQLFDVENLAYIPEDDSQQVRVSFQPDICGIHEIVFSAYYSDSAGQPPVQTSTYVYANINPKKEVLNLARYIRKEAGLPRRIAWGLSFRLKIAAIAFNYDLTPWALKKLDHFTSRVDKLRDKNKISPVFADNLLVEVEKIRDCVTDSKPAYVQKKRAARQETGLRSTVSGSLASTRESGRVVPMPWHQYLKSRFNKP